MKIELEQKKEEADNRAAGVEALETWEREANLRGATDLLALFMNRPRSRVAKGGRKMTVEEESTYLRDIIVSFIIAGRDTTASLLSWVFYELARPCNADTAARLRAEIDAVLGADTGDHGGGGGDGDGAVPCDGDLTYSTLLNKMPWLKACVYEAL